jgi:hypothetical protein
MLQVGATGIGGGGGQGDFQCVASSSVTRWSMQLPFVFVSTHVDCLIIISLQ